VHEVAFNDPVPGQDVHACNPSSRGYFGDWRWLQVDFGTAGRSRSRTESRVAYFGFSGPRDGQPPMLSFPDTGLALLDVIPGAADRSSTRRGSGPAVANAHVSAFAV